VGQGILVYTNDITNGCRRDEHGFNYADPTSTPADDVGRA